MQNIAIIRQGTGRYLFSLPDNVTLKEGDRVKCDTKHGLADGVAFADSAWVDENVSQLIGKLAGAKFPLKSVVGKMEYLPFEKPADKPADDKPIKLYCVKDSNPFGEVEFTKGTVCTFNPSVGTLTFPDGRRVGSAGCPRSYDEWKADNHSRADCLVPLVARPAKVGEWVLLDRDDCFGKNKKGDIANVVEAPSYTTTFCFISDPTLAYSGGICVNFESNYSYVLDGYKPEPEPEAEPEPEYFSGKVVCVDNGGKRFFEVGKVYCFYDGVIFGANGFYSSRYETLEKANCGIGSKFVEFKGEAK